MDFGLSAKGCSIRTYVHDYLFNIFLSHDTVHSLKAGMGSICLDPMSLSVLAQSKYWRLREWRWEGWAALPQKRDLRGLPFPFRYFMRFHRQALSNSVRSNTKFRCLYLRG